MDTSIRALVPDTPSTDGSEDSWTFLDDEHHGDGEPSSSQPLIDIKPIGPSDVESVEEDEGDVDARVDETESELEHIEQAEPVEVGTEAGEAEEGASLKR